MGTINYMSPEALAGIDSSQIKYGRARLEHLPLVALVAFNLPFCYPQRLVVSWMHSLSDDLWQTTFPSVQADAKAEAHLRSESRHPLP